MAISIDRFQFLSSEYMLINCTLYHQLEGSALMAFSMHRMASAVNPVAPYNKPSSDCTPESTESSAAQS